MTREELQTLWLDWEENRALADKIAQANIDSDDYQEEEMLRRFADHIAFSYVGIGVKDFLNNLIEKSQSKHKYKAIINKLKDLDKLYKSLLKYISPNWVRVVKLSRKSDVVVFYRKISQKKATESKEIPIRKLTATEIVSLVTSKEDGVGDV